MHTMNRKYMNGTMADQLIHEDEMNYVNNNFEGNVNNSPGYDVITVDPNCFYSSDDDEIVVDIEEDQIEMNIQGDNVAYSFEPQPPEDVTFDIANVNINDLLSNSIDTLNTHDEILFATRDDGIDQFDLAKYVDGGMSSLLLSPPPPVSVVRKFTPLKLTPASLKLASLNTNKSHQEEVDSSASSEQQIGKLPTKEHTHSNTAENLMRGNFRKRKILSRAFVDTTEDSDSENEAELQRKTIVQFKKHKNDDDPMWKPVLAPKTTCKTRGDKAKITKKEESVKEKSNEKSKIPSTAQSNGLRNILKRRMLSNRPMKKLVALPAKAAAPSTQKRSVGVGRGKDISITAKYFDLSAKQSDNSDRDNDDPFIHDNLDDDSESIESTKSVRSVDEMEETEKLGRVKIVDDSVAEMNEDYSNGACGDSKANVFEKQSQAEQKKTTAKAPTLIDNIEFARAIFVDMKAKPMKREGQKKGVSDDSSKRPPMLINVNKFKTNRLPAIIRSRPLSDLKPPNSDLKLIKTKSLPQIPIKTENPIKSEPKHDCIEQAIDETSASNATTATSSKKKLNIQEYLKRKCINPLGSERVKVCRDDHSYVKPSESTAAAAEDCAAIVIPESSLYEEITSVSIGCATDISIPELRIDNISGRTVPKAAALLSDIQTCLAIEQGKISSNSLISSIQSVILNKSTNQMQTADCVDKKNPSNTKSEEYEHGENKTIMHLRKDRIRPTTVAIAVQTDPYFQFPPLERLTPIAHADRCKSLGRNIEGDNRTNDGRSIRAFSMQNDRFAQRNYRVRKDQVESSYYSDDDESQQTSSPQRPSRHSEYIKSMAHGHREFRSRRKRSKSKSRKYRPSKFERHRTISRSLSQSSDNSSSSQSSSSTASSATTVLSASSTSLNSYGESSTKSHYGSEHSDRRSNRSPQSWSRNGRNTQSHRSTSPENRRIVYVGRIASETTKDDLRRIFSVYGRIENVSIHYKEMKWKYGFVTFERATDAYDAIDTGSNNPALKEYDISFGGRRAFCREKYLDLDNTERGYSSHTKRSTVAQPQCKDDSFEALLKKLKEKIQDTK